MQVTEQASEQQAAPETLPHIRPNHYLGKFGLRAEKIIFDYDLAYFPGAAVKYIIRAGNKPGEDTIKEYEKAIDSIDLTLEGPVSPRTGRTTFIEQTGSYIHLGAVRINEINQNFKMPIGVSMNLEFMLREIEECGRISNSKLDYLRDSIEITIEQLRSETAEVCS